MFYASQHNVSEDSDMSEPKFEVPAELRNMAERTMEQAEKAFDMFFQAANKYAPLSHPGAEVSKKALSIADQNMRSALTTQENLLRQPIFKRRCKYNRNS